MRITVFTPTFNRKKLIEKLFFSLLMQDFHDFEWIVVDDGSTDGTNLMFDSLTKKSPFPIRYIWKENGGKHRAINLGIQYASGDLFFIVDSDDQLPESSLSTIDRIEKEIPIEQKRDYAGVCGLKSHFDGKIVGTSFNGDFLDITSLEENSNCISGDKAEVFYTKLLKKYPFPEFDNEFFIPESVVWDKIAYDGYKLRFFNIVVYMCEYLPNGLSDNYESNILRNPKGYGLYLYQSILFGKINKKEKWVHIHRFYQKNKTSHSLSDISSYLHMKKLTLLFGIFGYRIKVFLTYYFKKVFCHGK